MARPGAELALADVRATRQAHAVVDHAVTVLVGAVARLDTPETTAAGVAHTGPLIDQAIAIVVLAVAELHGLRAALAAAVAHALVHLEIAVVVQAVAHLDRLGAAQVAGVAQPLVDPAVTVVVPAVADLHGHGEADDEPERELQRLAILGAERHAAVDSGGRGEIIELFPGVSLDRAEPDRVGRDRGDPFVVTVGNRSS